MLTTQAVTVLPIIKALVQATVFLTGVQECPDNWHTQWISRNDEQKILMQQYADKYQALSHCTQKELEAWVSTNAEELNEILAHKQFDLRFEQCGPNEFGMLSILNMDAQWKKEGYPTEIKCLNKKKYLGLYVGNFEIFSCPSHPHPIAALDTKSGDKIFLTEAVEQKTNFELLDRIQTIMQHMVKTEGYTGVIFPKAAINQIVNIPYLKGMKLHEKIVGQTQQQIKLQLNEEGAHVASAFMGVAAACSVVKTTIIPKNMIIKNPFLMWWQRSEIPFPVVAAIIAEDSWERI